MILHLYRKSGSWGYEPQVGDVVMVSSKYDHTSMWPPKVGTCCVVISIEHYRKAKPSYHTCTLWVEEIRGGDPFWWPQCGTNGITHHLSISSVIPVEDRAPIRKVVYEKEGG